jgi:hypothetical protein
MQSLVLLSGATISIDDEQIAVIHGVFTAEPDETVRLVNAAGEILGVAKVTASLTKTFALIQNAELANNSHPDMTSWPGAHAVLLDQIEEFRQTDQVTIVAFIPQAVTSVGIEINTPEEVTEVSEVEKIPSEDEQYASLDEVANV